MPPQQGRKGSATLVLSRKKNESIVINNDIIVVVVEIRGDKVRLGVEAAKEVPVHRSEVHYAIQRNNAAGIEKVEEPGPAIEADPEFDALQKQIVILQERRRKMIAARQGKGGGSSPE